MNGHSEARATGRISHNDRRFTHVPGRRLIQAGSGMSVALSRLAYQVRHRPSVAARPPGIPELGFGSPDLYIADRTEEYSVGSDADGTRVWWYVPDKLLHGSHAPAVIYLHGFRASIPDLYSEHIHHLTRQGLVVIFPRYNAGSLKGMFTDNDQEAMIDRAIGSVNRALDELGPLVDRGRLYNFGHSLGGLFAACWAGRGGPKPHGVVLAHPSISLDKIPAFVRDNIRRLDYRDWVGSLDVPVTVLCGESDTIAPTAEAYDLLQMLPHSPSRRLFEARSDAYGAPRLIAGHMATVRDDSHMLHAVLEGIGGGTIGDDTLHYRFYYAALDAMVLGHAPQFDMGHWSDGTPVKPIRELPFDP